MPRRIKIDSEETSIENNCHLSDLKVLAVQCIRRFFKGRKSLSGVNLTDNHVVTKENIHMVMRTPFDDDVFNYIHSECLPVIPKSKKYHDPTLPWSVHCLLVMIGKLKKLKIPKEFQPGMLLLYFKHCKGVVLSHVEPVKVVAIAA